MTTQKKVSSDNSVALTEEQKARLREQSGMQSGGVRLPLVERITLNGNCDAIEDEKGNLVRPPVTFRSMDLANTPKDERPVNIPIGSSLDVIFVKIRRRLVARDSKGFQVMSSTQHGHKDQVVSLWKEEKLIDTGKASELRVKYEDLRTVQEIYILHEGKLKMLIVKGAALGSETRDKKYPTFYEYLQSISSEGIFSCVTKLGGVKEKGAKDFYTMTFEKGRPTTAEEQLAVLSESDKLTEIIKEYDKENSVVRNGENKKEMTEGEKSSDPELESLANSLNGLEDLNEVPF